MLRNCESAKKIAEFLERVEEVDKVYFPDLSNHDTHEVAKKQMNSYGSMVSFEIKGGKEVGMNFLDALELCTIAVSLGAAKPLIEYPTCMTHSTYTAEGLKGRNT